MIYVRRPGSGLVEPAEIPALTLEAAVERSWQPREGGRLLEPKPPPILPTRPWPDTKINWEQPGWLRSYLEPPWGPVRGR